jgi:tetratricopeptide (TPR) repeat protein
MFRDNAVAFAWKDLCRAVWRGPALALDKASLDLGTPFINLAVVYGNLGRQERAARILGQAIRRRATASLHFERGKLLRNRNRNSQAVSEYRHALSFAATMTERARYYAYIAEAQAQGKVSQQSLAADSIDPYEAALASPSTTDDDTRTTLMNACLAGNKFEQLSVVLCVTRTLAAVRAKRGESGAERLKLIGAQARRERKAQPTSPERTAIARWSSAIFVIEIAQLLMSDPPSPRSYRRSNFFCDMA